MLREENIAAVGKVLRDEKRPLKQRFRALFTLRNVGSDQCVHEIGCCFTDSSALLRHECAYVLGQMQNRLAIPRLVEVLENRDEDIMVRHEAGEALGAIGDVDALHILQKYANDPVIEVAETCQIAIARLKHENSVSADGLFNSVDPAPPCDGSKPVSELRQTLLDESQTLFERYRAMFALRNLKSSNAVLALAEGLACPSALFRHEIAYVLGQLQHPDAVKKLCDNLRDVNESPMVRHECAEALGSIATEECIKVLQDYQEDKVRAVKESCEIALDMCDYENSEEFQYANALETTKSPVTAN